MPGPQGRGRRTGRPSSERGEEGDGLAVLEGHEPGGVLEDEIRGQDVAGKAPSGKAAPEFDGDAAHRPGVETFEQASDVVDRRRGTGRAAEVLFDDEQGAGGGQ